MRQILVFLVTFLAHEILLGELKLVSFNFVFLIKIKKLSKLILLYQKSFFYPQKLISGKKKVLILIVVYGQIWLSEGQL